MTLLKILLSTVLVVGASSERFTRQATLRDDDAFQTVPKRALVAPGGSITIIGNAGVPLQSCHFYFPYPRSKWPVDFSLGPNSNSTDDRYEYFGRGLEYGDCGMRIKRVAVEDDGIIQCDVLPVGNDGPDDWERCATTLRVTNVREEDLPVFNIEPSRNLIHLAKGDSLTIKCNADRPITLCHIYLPGPIFLNMDKGVNSTTSTSQHRYHGNGLEKGECGATLTGVDEKLNGYVVCKVGSWPETVEGKWETDSFQVKTKEFLTTPDRPREPTKTVGNATACPPLVYSSINVVCLFAGNVTDCSQPQRIRSIAFMDCKPGYVIPNRIIYRKITCLKGGVWDPPPIACQPDCGRRITNEGVPFIANGNNTTIGEFPWHIGIYELSNNELIQACGGTLITSGLVVSAAHCFWNNVKQVKRDPSLFRVAAGKHIREWEDESAWVQKREVLEIIVPNEYHGRGTNFNSDIALVRLKRPFEITSVVNLVCVDWNHEFEHKQLKMDSMGIVTGWGFTETGFQSDVLQYLSLPYRSREACLQSLRVEVQTLLTEDKFCAGYINESKSVCRGDSGGGLVYLEPRSNKHYLRGLVSIAFMKNPTGPCNMQDYTGFTRFDQYLSWVQDNLNFDYSKIQLEPEVQQQQQQPLNGLNPRPTKPVVQQTLIGINPRPTVQQRPVRPKPTKPGINYDKIIFPKS